MNMILTVVYLIVIWLLLNQLNGSASKSKSKSKCGCDEGMSGGRVTVFWFHKPGCPHCVNMAADWRALTRAGLPNKYIFTPVDTSKAANQKLAAKFGVQGVPHIVKADSKDNILSIYKGDRSVADMKKWVLK